MATVRTRKRTVPGASERTGRGSGHEFRGITILGTGLLLFLSLVSYLPAPPRSATTNLVGPVGQRLAEILLAFSGVVSYVWIAVLVALGVGLLIGQIVRFPLRRMMNGVLCLLLLSVLVHIFTAPQRIHGFPAGGILAAWIGEISRALFHTVGSLVIFGAAFLSMVLITLERSLLVLMRSGLLHVQEVLEGSPLTRKRSSSEDSGLTQLDEEVEAGDDEHAEIDVEIAQPSAQAPTVLARPTDTFEHSGNRPGTKPTLLKRIFGKFRREDDVVEIEPDVDPPENSSESQGFFDLKDAREGSDEIESAPVEATADPVPEAAVETVQADQQPDADDLRDYERVEPPPIPQDAVKPEAAKPAQRQATEVHEPEVVESEAMQRSTKAPAGPKPKDQLLPLNKGVYNLPSLNLLSFEPPVGRNIDQGILKRNAEVLVEKLSHFKVECAVSRIRPGPVVTMYEVKPARGVKISKITTLADDLAMALQAEQIRIVAPIPGRDVVGIEVPNEAREMVFLKEVLSDSTFDNKKAKLPLGVGKDIFGQPVSSDLARMPHLLVAGATGSGKSVAVNTFIVSLLYSKTPDQVRMIMIDPKMLELSIYEGIPHLLLPVVTDPKRATLALRWAVAEMERRYNLLKPAGVRNIDGYNAHVDRLHAKARGKRASEDLPERLPYLVVIIDELADLMMVAGKDVESSIARLAQMARAAGIHLIVATQRPSVDVITGLIKANFPTRMSFRVASKVDSRTVLDAMGAERLLGMGDMLFLPPGSSHVLRIHGGYISDEDVQKAVDYVKSQRSAQYDPSVLDAIETKDDDEGGDKDIEHDPLYDEAVAVVARSRRATISYLQRELGVGYNRASRLMEQLEMENVVGPQIGTKAREIFVQPV